MVCVHTPPGLCFRKTKDLESVACEKIKHHLLLYILSTIGDEDENRQYPTETDSQYLPKQRISKVIQLCRSRGNLRRAISVRRAQLRHFSENEVVEGNFALTPSVDTQLGESLETVLLGLVRERRGEDRVSSLTAEEKREPVQAQQSEFSNFVKHAAV